MKILHFLEALALGAFFLLHLFAAQSLLPNLIKHTGVVGILETFIYLFKKQVFVAILGQNISAPLALMLSWLPQRNGTCRKHPLLTHKTDKRHKSVSTTIAQHC